MYAYNALIQDKSTHKNRVVKVYADNINAAYKKAIKYYPMQVKKVKSLGARLF